MNVLITGGLGHIGSKLARAYSLRPGIGTIRILDNIMTQRYCSLFNLPPDSGKKYEFIEGDITDKKILGKALDNIDEVIHLAAITDAPSTIQKPEITEEVNFKGMKTVLDASMKTNVKKFFFPSSTSVYGEADGLVDEKSPENVYKPATPYAVSKFKAEKLLQKTYRDNGFNVYILRKGTIFGKSIGMRFHTAVNKFCWLAAMNQPLTVWDSALESMRPYLGLRDAIRAYAFIGRHGKPGEIYNVLTKNYSMKEILDSIRKFVPDLKIQITKSPLLNQKPYEVSSEKVKRLGFEFKDDLVQNIGETIKLFRGIRNG